MQQHGSKYLARRHHHPQPWGSKGRNSIFSEHGHVAYQIKGNHACGNMVANILPADPQSPRPWGDINSKKDGKDQESIQLSATPDQGYHMGKWQNHN